MDIETQRLRKFLKANIPFAALKKAGFFAPTVRATDYGAQAERVCEFFGLKSIYDYASLGQGVSYHLTETEDVALPSPVFSRTIKNAFGENICSILESESR